MPQRSSRASKFPTVVLPEPEMPEIQTPIHAFISLLWLDVCMLEGTSSLDSRMLSLGAGNHVMQTTGDHRLIIPALVFPMSRRSRIMEGLIGTNRAVVAFGLDVIDQADRGEGPIGYLLSLKPTADPESVRQHLVRFHNVPDHHARWLTT